MLRRTVYLDEKCSKWLDGKPRSFNFSEFVRIAIEEKIKSENESV